MRHRERKSQAMALLAAVLPGGFAHLVGRERDNFQTESKNLMRAGEGKPTPQAKIGQILSMTWEIADLRLPGCIVVCSNLANAPLLSERSTALAAR